MTDKMLDPTANLEAQNRRLSDQLGRMSDSVGGIAAQLDGLRRRVWLWIAIIIGATVFNLAYTFGPIIARHLP